MRWRYMGPWEIAPLQSLACPANLTFIMPAQRPAAFSKPTDGGIHWEAIFDGQPVSSIGSLWRLRHADPTSFGREPAKRGFVSQQSQWARGIYKSGDAGKTWKLMVLEKTGRIGHLVVDPKIRTS